MASDTREMPELLSDILQLVFSQLAGDHETLLNISLTCRTWRWLALPSLYQVVDFHRHRNNGSCELSQPLHYNDRNNQSHIHNLIPRQHAFLRLMASKPQLANYVKSLTWVIVWRRRRNRPQSDRLKEIDRHTWNVFSRMANVTHLDLTSAHDVDAEDYVRQNPARLFPKVRDLRLQGWMHRGLVMAICKSLDPKKLQNLRLDYLEDEGALPNGKPMYRDVASRIRRARPREGVGRLDFIDDDLIARQEAGQACILPGPMWWPLHFLTTRPLDSLTHLQIKVPHSSVDHRHYYTLCLKAAAFIVKVRQTLRSLVVVFAENRDVYRRSIYLRSRRVAVIRLRRLQDAKFFLDQLLAALNDNTFPRLERVRCEGFYIFLDASLEEVASAGIASTFQLIRDCPFADASFIEVSSLDDRGIGFRGHDRDYHRIGEWHDDGEFAELLASS